MSLTSPTGSLYPHRLDADEDEGVPGAVAPDGPRWVWGKVAILDTNERTEIQPSPLPGGWVG